MGDLVSICDLEDIILSPHSPSQETIDQIRKEYTGYDLTRAWRVAKERLRTMPFGDCQQYAQASANARANYDYILDHLKNSQVGVN